MDFIISFFRDTLDGTTYVIVCSVSAVLLCACIGYLADKKARKKAYKAVENEVKQPVNNPVENIVSPQMENAIPVMPSETENQVMPTFPTEPQMIEQMEETIAPTPMATPQMPVGQPTQAPDQPIFPPVESPVGIVNNPVEATAPTPSFSGEPQQNQSINSNLNSNVNLENTTQQINQNPQANANPNLNIPEGQVPTQLENNIALPNEQQPVPQPTNLDMPQMPIGDPTSMAANNTQQINQNPQASVNPNLNIPEGQVPAQPTNQIIN